MNAAVKTDYELARNDASAWSSKIIREQIDRLYEVKRNLEYKDFYDEADKQWIARTDMAICAYHDVLKEREASDLEIDGAVNIELLCNAWKGWLDIGEFDPLYWSLHGLLYCKFRHNQWRFGGHKYGNPIEDVAFLKSLVETLKGEHNEKADS